MQCVCVCVFVQCSHNTQIYIFVFVSSVNCDVVWEFHKLKKLKSVFYCQFYWHIHGNFVRSIDTQVYYFFVFDSNLPFRWMEKDSVTYYSICVQQVAFLYPVWWKADLETILVTTVTFNVYSFDRKKRLKSKTTKKKKYSRTKRKPKKRYWRVERARICL